MSARPAPSNTKGVFVAWNGIRMIGVIAAPEEDLGRPVLTANQAAYGTRYAWQVSPREM
jgi:maleate isomerase